MSEMAFKEKIIAFVDVLGFKRMVEAAEERTGRSLAEIDEILNELGRSKDKEFFQVHGPQICPHSAYTQKDLEFEVTQVSDCAIASAEVSPAGVINLINHCWSSAITLLSKGVMVRGYITFGKVFHEANKIIGSGYQRAYQRESEVTAFKREADERGTPFIELDRTVCDYVKNCTDECVQKMFDRYVKSDGDVTAIFPFQVLAHSFAIGGFGIPPFNAQEQKENNNRMRQMLRDLKLRVLQYVDNDNVRATAKAAHYISALDKQLDVCDATDEIIDALVRPFAGRK